MHDSRFVPPIPVAASCNRLALWLLRWLCGWLLAVALGLMNSAWAQPNPWNVELASIDVTRGDEGLNLSFAMRFEMPRLIEDALLKGTPLHFVVDADLMRERWYWRDKRIARASRTWRLAYMPLTRQFRVSFGGLNQNFDNLSDALASVRRASDFKVADLRDVEEGAKHYLLFTYKLDTTLLPRPMQIGIGGQPEWNLRLENMVRFE